MIPGMKMILSRMKTLPEMYRLMTDKTFIEHYLLEVYSEENGHFDQENVHAMIEEIKNAI